MKWTPSLPVEFIGLIIKVATLSSSVKCRVKFLRDLKTFVSIYYKLHSFRASCIWSLYYRIADVEGSFPESLSALEGLLAKVMAVS